jgi:hypothetical protein
VDSIKERLAEVGAFRGSKELKLMVIAGSYESDLWTLQEEETN